MFFIQTGGVIAGSAGYFLKWAGYWRSISTYWGPKFTVSEKIWTPDSWFLLEIHQVLKLIENP